VLIKVHPFAIPMGFHGLYWSLCLFKNYLLIKFNLGGDFNIAQ